MSIKFQPLGQVVSLQPLLIVSTTKAFIIEGYDTVSLGQFL